MQGAYIMRKWRPCCGPALTLQLGEHGVTDDATATAEQARTGIQGPDRLPERRRHLEPVSDRGGGVLVSGSLAMPGLVRGARDLEGGEGLATGRGPKRRAEGRRGGHRGQRVHGNS